LGEKQYLILSFRFKHNIYKDLSQLKIWQMLYFKTLSSR